jgi:hypothetical protein
VRRDAPSQPDSGPQLVRWGFLMHPANSSGVLVSRTSSGTHAIVCLKPVQRRRDPTVRDRRSDRRSIARNSAARRLAQYEAIRKELEQEADHTEDRPFWLLTVSAGEHNARAAMAWADETIAALDEIGASTDAPKERRRR